MELKGKVIVITGGTRGLGYSLAKQLKNEGAKIVVCSHNLDHVEKAKDELIVDSILADVTKESDLKNLAKEVLDKFGHINIWINNAGVFHMTDPNKAYDNTKAHEMFEVNVFGTILGSRVARDSMNNLGGGIILNIISSNALDATKGQNTSIYAASKWAVRGYTEAFRNENKDSGIKTFSVYSGGIKTHLWDEKKPDSFNLYMEPDYVAEKIVSNLKLEKPEEELIIKRPVA